MKYQLITKVNRTIRVLQTPAGVQIWMKGKQVKGAGATCAACNKEIGVKPFFAPIAGEALPNPTERIHVSCMRKLELLPMITNTLLSEEENRNGRQR